MSVDSNTIALIISGIACLFIGALVNRIFERKPRLIVYLGHTSAFKLRSIKEGPNQIFTHSVVVRNAGRKPTHNLRIGHIGLPEFQIYPKVQYNVINLPDGGKGIVLPTLVSKEQITISYLYLPPLTWAKINTHFKSDEGFAKTVTMLLTPIIPKWAKALLVIILIVGSITIIYLFVLLIKWFMSIV